MSTTARTPFKVQRLPQVVGASVTSSQIGAPFPITGDGMNLRVDLLVSGVTAATGITISLQDSNIQDADGVPLWRPVAGITSAVAADGRITLISASALLTSGPLGNIARLVVTTGAGDAVTVEEARVLQA